jgi:small ubiquitin-related modifier
LRFYTSEGGRVQAVDTPDSLELEDGDLIDVHIEQQGGADDF